MTSSTNNLVKRRPFFGEMMILNMLTGGVLNKIGGSDGPVIESNRGAAFKQSHKS